MKGIRQKGFNYERYIAEKFSKPFNMEFRRIPLSGGWDKEYISGDIMCMEDKNFPFSIECKRNEAIDFMPIFKNFEKSAIFSFWKQCEEDAKVCKKENNIPLLVFAKNYTPDFVMFKEKICLGNFVISGNEFSRKIWIREGNYEIVLLDEFLPLLQQLYCKYREEISKGKGK